MALVLAASSLGAPARAQDAALEAGPRALPTWVADDPFSEGEDDPLGIDGADRLERVEPTRPEEEVSRAVPVQRGAVLSAIAGVREVAHEVVVTLEHGLAIVDVEMRLTSSARVPAEVRLRLPVPSDAALARLEICDARGCREGEVDASEGPLGPYDDAVRSQTAEGAPLPVAHAARGRDGRGEALFLRAAPVMPSPPAQRRREAPDAALIVRVRYVASAPVRGGRARIVLPARGQDDRVVAASVRVRSTSLGQGAVDGVEAIEAPVERAPWEDVEISGRLDRGAPRVEVEAWRVPCAGAVCARVRAVAGPREPAAREVILLLDVSPSMAGPARGRLGATVGALLSLLPSSARVRIAAFAAHAVAVVPVATAPTEVSLDEVSRALERPLGSATRFEAAWELVAPWVREADDPLVVIVGDGGLTRGASEPAFRQARRAGAELASINVADRATTRGLEEALAAASGIALDVGTEAHRAAEGHGMDPLRERLARLLSPTVERALAVRHGSEIVSLGALRAGEELVWEGPLTGALAVRGGRPVPATAPPTELALALDDRLSRASGRRARPLRLAALARASIASQATCRASGTFTSASAPVARGVRLALVETRRCDVPAIPEAPTNLASGGAAALEAEAPSRLRRQRAPATLPREALRVMLRQRLVPVARGCFRDDRAGRANYQRRAVYRFSLADREVTEASVTGRVEPALRDCLVRAVDDLEVPAFEGAITVSYPLYTEPQLPPPTLSLEAEVADTIDAIAPEPTPNTSNPL